jgi:uncharacterized protein
MNRLAHETSPYLQQHAANPVDWYPWGEEALERARREDKPILLSIGYSACHWCHVMAHESFEDLAVARVMNEHFVNIKVDREERPDIDQIYQTAHQMLARRAGGWPLTMFLTPDQAPFFGGTYFPKEPRYNLPGFVQLMERVVVAYRHKRAEIDAQNEVILQAFANEAASMGDAGTPAGGAGVLPALDRVDTAIAALARRFDREHGGFGDAPKFPHPTDRDALHVALHTLERMAAGGIYDHLGGGFCRYSVDREWMIPHFEKMLYDNGPLLGLYVDAWRLTRRPETAQVVEETAAWLMREMQSPEGGYFSSLDADSEGEEGKFYRWTRDEVVAALAPEELAIVEQYYGLAGHANFEGHYWHLHVIQPLDAAASRAGLPIDRARLALDSARAKLATVRAARVRPGRDDKVLTSWNALAIAGMARAAAAFDRDDWLDSARRAMDFIATTMWRDGRLPSDGLPSDGLPSDGLPSGRLLATYKDGRAHLNAYLDDYAFTLAALLELMQAEFRVADCTFARALADALLAHFQDTAAGGFFFTSHDHERLIHRPKQGYDNATPAGNGIAAYALQRLGHLLGEPRYLDAAARAIAAFAGALAQQPAGFASLLAALAEAHEPPRIVILRGRADDAHPWRRALAAAYRPDLITLAIDADAGGLPEALAKPPARQGVNAYLCQGVSCSPSMDTIGALEAALGPAAVQ